MPGKIQLKIQHKYSMVDSGLQVFNSELLCIFNQNSPGMKIQIKKIEIWVTNVQGRIIHDYICDLST
jgi:hypothetical protein